MRWVRSDQPAIGAELVARLAKMAPLELDTAVAFPVGPDGGGIKTVIVTGTG